MSLFTAFGVERVRELLTLTHSGRQPASSAAAAGIAIDCLPIRTHFRCVYFCTLALLLAPLILT